MTHTLNVLIDHHENGEKRNLFTFNTEKNDNKSYTYPDLGKKHQS